MRLKNLRAAVSIADLFGGRQGAEFTLLITATCCQEYFVFMLSGLKLGSWRLHQQAEDYSTTWQLSQESVKVDGRSDRDMELFPHTT